MRPRRVPVAVDVRHVGAAVVLLVCVAGTVVGRAGLTHVLGLWFAALMYLAFCMEPVRRIRKRARVTWALATTFVFVTLCCVGFASCLPVNETGPGTYSLVSRAFGVGALSGAAQDRFLTATWLCFAGVAIGTLALWYEVLRLARRSEWRSIDHGVGDGSFLTGATLQNTAGGTGVTRPVHSRPARRR